MNVESEIWTFVQLIKITACMRSAGYSQLHCALTANLNVKTHVCVCVSLQTVDPAGLQLTEVFLDFTVNAV